MITIAATQTTDVSDMDNANLPVYAQASDVKGAADATETQQQATQGDITQTGDMMTAITLGGMFIALAIATIIAGRRLSENGNTLAIGTSIAVGGFLLLLALIMSVGVANAAEEAIPDDGVIATTTTEKPADAQTEAFTIVSGELTANGVSLTKEVGTTTTEVITKEDGTKEAVTKEKTAKDDPGKLPSNVNKEPTPVTEKKQAANNSGQKKTVTRTGANVYRLYSPSTGRHLLTASIGEAKTITEKLGWHWENVAFVMPNKGDADANVPVYRLYNKNSSEHFYTASGEEKNNVLANGWTDEGIAFYAPSHSGIPVYRLYNKNNGDHMFTASKGEYDSLKAAGWADEHVAFYAKSNEPLNLGKGFWMVSTSYAKNNNLERLWVDANGSIASNRLIDPANANDAGAGYKAYAKPDCTVVRGAWNNDTGYVYLADNDGRLYADKTGWLVTSQYDGGLQRYYMEKGQNGIIAAKIGSFKVDGKSYYGRSDKGYVVRGTYDDGVLIYHANNEGVITGTEPSKKVKAGGLGNRIAALACYVAGCADPEPAVTTGVSDGSRAWQAPDDPRYQNYKKLMDTAYAHGGAKVYASCIQAAIGVICATVDPDAVDGSGGVPEGYNYFNNHPNLYQKMAYSNMGNLKPGDVLVTVRGNHTIIYVGNQMAQTYHPGATGNVYEASFHGGKYPNIATYDEGKFGYQGFTVFRPKTVNSSPSRPTIDLKSLIGFEYASGEVNQITAPSVASADWFNNDKAFVQHCEQLASRYDSDTGMFICSDTSKCRFVVLQRQNDGSWKAVGGWNSAFGKLENGRSLTKRGAYKIVAKEEADTGRLYEGSAAAGGPRAEGNSWDIFYCNHSNIDDGGMVIEENGHSGLANGPLGKRYCSHGGTCLPYGLTEWVSKNCPLKTTVLVFDDTNPTPSWYQWD